MLKNLLNTLWLLGKRRRQRVRQREALLSHTADQVHRLQTDIRIYEILHQHAEGPGERAWAIRMLWVKVLARDALEEAWTWRNVHVRHVVLQKW